MQMAVFDLDQNYSQQQSSALDEVRDYVDVKYTFSCKLCRYSSTSSNDIWHHVVETHLDSRRSLETNGDMVSSHENVVTCSDFSYVLDPVSTSAVVLNTSACNHTIINSPINGTTESEFENNCISDASRLNNQSPLTQPEELLERINPDRIILPEALTVSSEDNCSNNFTAAEHPIPVIKEVAKDSEIVVEFLRVDGKDDYFQEIFICRSCGTGFTSTEMVENKSSMRAMHVNSVFKTISCQNTTPIECSSSFSSAMPASQIVSIPNVTSTGTQVQLVKKPGRKRKVVTDTMFSKKNVAHTSCDKCNTSDISDIKGTRNEIKEYISSNNDTRSLSSKRQIRPPRRLVKDYHIVHHRHWKRPVGPTEKVPKFKCIMEGCDAVFNNQEGLTYHSTCHSMENSSVLKFSCSECQRPFQTWIKLHAHLQVAHKIVMDWFYCSGCDFSSETASLLEDHNAAVHSGEILLNISDREQNYCPKRSDGSAVKKSNHGLSMDDECNICKRTFANRKSLVKHTEVVHDKLKTFICSMCGYSSARKATLQLHMRIHTGEKPFRCDLCIFSASDHNTLRRHRMRHTGQKAYSCSFCMYTCIQAASLKLHVRSKHPHAQPVAETSQSQTGTVVFACSTCPYQTVNRRSYLSHVTNHENASLSSYDVVRNAEAIVDDLTSSLADDSAVTYNSISASQAEAEMPDSPSLSSQLSDQFNLVSSSKTFTVLSYETVGANSNGKVFSVLPP